MSFKLREFVEFWVGETGKTYINEGEVPSFPIPVAEYFYPYTKCLETPHS